MWGQEFDGEKVRLDLGIIPTRVGTSVLYIGILTPPKDHPHACGDKTSEAELC